MRDGLGFHWHEGADASRQARDRDVSDDGTSNFSSKYWDGCDSGLALDL